MLKPVNNLNNSIKHVAFEANAKGSTSCDFITPEGGDAEVCTEVPVRFPVIVREAFPSLKPYAK